ncbi:hypothetical protein MNJPNG_05010 [Cupriavidus oxalaticus]|uniref:glycosyl hydrolase family 28-related protein n=1 Tax=Cupriavidus oxalaticus TaxID=96344 RepID=UPI003F73DFF2
MAQSLLIEPVQSYEDSNGKPLNGGQLFTYSAGTLTPKATYQDADGATPNTNPIILNERGEAVVYGSGNYRMILKNAAGATIWDRDNVDSGGTYDGNDLDTIFKSQVNRVVDSISALRALDKTAYTRAFVTGYYAASDGGGGPYALDPSDTTSVDNGGTIVVANDGGRWKLQLIGPISVKQFGAKGDNSTDDAQNIQKAITWVSSVGGGEVYFPLSTYLIGTPLTVPASVMLRGTGEGSRISPKVAMNNLITMNGSLYTAVVDLGIENASALAGHGIVVNNSSQFARIERCLLTNFGTGAAIFIDAGANAVRILDNTFIGSLFGVFINDCGVNSIIANNHIQSGTGIWMQKITTQPEGVRIIGNIILPSNISGQVNSGYGIVIASSCLEISILSNIIDQGSKFAIYFTQPTTGLQQAVKITDNWLTGSAGVKITSNATRDCHIVGNTITGCSDVGLDAGNSGAVQLFVRDNHFYANTNFDYNLGGVVQSSFTGNKFNSTASGLEDAACQIVWTNNDFTAAPTAVSALSRYRYNTGYLTNNGGSTTWASGSSTLTINHGLNITPSLGSIHLTTTGSLGAWWVNTINATQITFQAPAAPGGDIAVAWEVSPPA